MARRTKGLATPKAARRRERKRKAGIQVRRKKEFTYRGLTMEKLQELDFGQFIQMLPARQRRSFKRGLSREQAKLINDSNQAPEKVIRTHRREMIIIPQFVGRKFAIHDGRNFVDIDILPEMIGLYFGELAPTRTSPTHTGPGVGATKSSKFMPLKRYNERFLVPV